MSKEINIAVNSFAERHFGEGKTFSRWTQSPAALVVAVKNSYTAGNVRPGYREGVVLVRMNGAGFTSPVVTLIEGDEGAVQAPAACADVVLYASSRAA